MERYGIKNITEDILNFHYDKFYRDTAMQLKKEKTKEEQKQIRKIAREKLDVLVKNVQIDLGVLKQNFVNLIQDENSARYLWILYSKYEGNENYIDKISDILKRENQIIRGGINTYKINGWMAHSLYVYQIVNENIAKNVDILNFKGKEEGRKQLQELHKIYSQLNEETKFILKIFALIHDIGVIESVEYHDRVGSKYVETVLQEIGFQSFECKLKNIIPTLQALIKYHTLITSLSSESSDAYVEVAYRKLRSQIQNSYVPEILLLFAYGDVIAVDESLMDTEKYQRTKECYMFFKEIEQGKRKQRNKEKVAIQRICDIVGEKKVENLTANFATLLQACEVDKNQFVEDMYHIKLMRYTGPLMKTLQDVKLTIKIFYELFELIGITEGKEALKDYTIIFLPNKQEENFVEQFKNGNFFACVNKMKENKKNVCTYEKVNIVKGIKKDGKYLHISV